jgi:hypothetical protein
MVKLSPYVGRKEEKNGSLGSWFQEGEIGVWVSEIFHFSCCTTVQGEEFLGSLRVVLFVQVFYNLPIRTTTKMCSCKTNICVE